MTLSQHNNDDAFQILHLVRDPRAIYQSMSTNPSVWKAHMKDKSLLCQRMRDDLQFARKVDKNRYSLTCAWVCTFREGEIYGSKEIN